MKKYLVLIISLLVVIGISSAFIGCTKEVNFKFDSINQYGNNSTNIKLCNYTAKQGDWIIISVKEGDYKGYSLRLISLTSDESYILKKDAPLRDESGFFNISIVENNIYYTTLSVFGTPFRFHQYNINTKQDNIICEGNIANYMATENNVFYVLENEDDEYVLLQYNLDTGKSKFISNINYVKSYGGRPVFYNDIMYYVNKSDGDIYMLSLDDEMNVPIKLYENLKDYNISDMVVYRDKLYINNGNTIFCWNYNEKEFSEVLRDEYIKYVWVFGDKLVYYSENQLYETYYLSTFDLTARVSEKIFESKGRAFNVSVFDDVFIVEGEGEEIVKIDIYSLSGELLKTYFKD